MITSILVDGFKTLSQFNLTLRPGLNILVGPNGSGKTNIVSFFEFLSLLVDRDPSEATSQLGGAGAVFRRVQDTYQSQISATVTGCYSLKDTASRLPFDFETGDKQPFAAYHYTFKVLFSNELESVVFTEQNLRYRHTPEFVADDGQPESRTWDVDLRSKLENDLRTTIKFKSLRGAALELFPFARDTRDDKAKKQVEEFFSRVISPTMSLPSLLTRFTPRMLMLSSDLSGGQTYNIIPSRVKVLEDSAKPPGINSDGSGLSSTLYSLRRRTMKSDAQFWGLYSQQRRASLKTPSLKTLLGYFQLANNSIQDIEVINDPFTNQLRVTFVVKNGDYVAKVPLSLMSDGTLKWLTLLTAALTASSVLSIEEPENYLHPNMQGQFVKIMREVLFTERQNSCTLMTTHSETLLNHCRPSELIVVSLRDGRTVSLRCENEVDLSDEIARTGFGLGYYYIAGALQHE